MFGEFKSGLKNMLDIILHILDLSLGHGFCFW